MQSVQAPASAPHPSALPTPSQSLESRWSRLRSVSPTPSSISDSEYETAEEYFTYPTPPDPVIESMVGRIPRGLDALGLEFQGIAAGLPRNGCNERGRVVRLRRMPSGGLRVEVEESEEDDEEPGPLPEKERVKEGFWCRFYIGLLACVRLVCPWGIYRRRTGERGWSSSGEPLL